MSRAATANFTHDPASTYGLFQRPTQPAAGLLRLLDQAHRGTPPTPPRRPRRPRGLPPKSATVRACKKAILHLAGVDDRPHGEASPKSFGQHYDVRFQVVVFEAKPAPCASEAGLDLVYHQESAPLTADVLGIGKEIGLADVNAPLRPG